MDNVVHGVSVYFQNWKGERDRKVKRGFKTKREAVSWESEFLQKEDSDPTMTFEDFVQIYISDMQTRIREHTWQTKNSIIEGKILPYFKDRKIGEIAPKDVIQWQNEMMNQRNEKGRAFSQTYLKSMHNQLSAIFNHAVRFYELKSNPAQKAGNMGKEKNKEIEFWTKEEYLKFSEAMMNKPVSFYAFEMLYWTDIRLGELLALTPADFDFKAGTVTINKSYQRLSGRDVITTPKTAKSNRTISIPDFVRDEMQDYMKTRYKIQPNERIFSITKSYLHNEMDRGSKEVGVKRIKVHGCRHSHISLLIDMGFSAVAIADRVGHESIDIIYRYAHMFPTKQKEIADKLTIERGV